MTSLHVTPDLNVTPARRSRADALGLWVIAGIVGWAVIASTASGSIGVVAAWSR